MKFLYTSDLHGEISFYHNLLDLAVSSSAEIIVLGGDLLPSFPPTKRYEDIIPHQKSFIEEFLFSLFKKILRKTTVKQILLIPGNWDLSYPYLFKEPIEGIIDLDRKRHRFENGYELIGYPFVPPTPFRPKDYEKMDDLEAPWPPQKNPSYIQSPDQIDQLVAIDPNLYLKQRETIAEDLNQLPRPLDYRKAIYIMHSPPFGTRLDHIQGGKSGGSRSIKTFIEKTQPLLTLHGHIHESPELSGAYFDQIGETLSVNPGQPSWTGKGLSKLNAVTFEMENPGETLALT